MPRTALNKVIQWSNMTVHALQSLEWQTVGYEMKPDGTSDQKRPIMRCPGCWTYADTLSLPTRGHAEACVVSNALTKCAAALLPPLPCVCLHVIHPTHPLPPPYPVGPAVTQVRNGRAQGLAPAGEGDPR